MAMAGYLLSLHRSCLCLEELVLKHLRSYDGRREPPSLPELCHAGGNGVEGDLATQELIGVEEMRCGVMAGGNAIGREGREAKTDAQKATQDSQAVSP